MNKKRDDWPDLSTMEAIAHEFARMLTGPLSDRKLCWCCPIGSTVPSGSCALCKALVAYRKLKESEP